MTDQLPSDEDLLQRRLDGTLTAEESARLDVRLTESAPLSACAAAQLAVLAEALESVKTSDPAPALGPRVMSQIHPRVESISGRRASIAARQEAGMSQAGISKKVVWGLATAAAVVLGVWLVKGSSDVGGPTAGTVGVAKRYAAPQISDADVKLDASLQTVQAFLDSEAFGRVMTDPEAIALLGDPAVRAAIGARAANRDTSPSPISNAAISAVIDDPSFVVLVTNPTFESSWVDAAHSVAEATSAAGATQLASQGAAGLASQGAAGLASQGAAGLASQNAAGLNTRLASQGAAGVQGAAGLASQNAAGLNTRLASQSAAGVAVQGAAGLASQNAAGLNTRLASQSAAGVAVRAPPASRARTRQASTPGWQARMRQVLRARVPRSLRVKVRRASTRDSPARVRLPCKASSPPSFRVSCGRSCKASFRARVWRAELSRATVSRRFLRPRNCNQARCPSGAPGLSASSGLYRLNR